MLYIYINTRRSQIQKKRKQTGSENIEREREKKTANKKANDEMMFYS